MTVLLVAGGGIGGLATALAVARPDRHVVVLERNGAFSEMGAGIQIAPNGLYALDRLGVGQTILDCAVPIDALRFRNGVSGRTVITLPLGSGYSDRFSYPYVVVQRGELHRTLLEACRSHSGIELLPGAEVVAVEDQGSVVRAQLADGSSRSGDLLVAADGVHSRVRAQLLDDGPLRPLGITVFRSVVPMERVPPTLQANEAMWWAGPGCHLVHYPIAGGRMLNLAPSAETSSDEIIANVEVDGDRVHRELASLCPGAQAMLKLGGPWRAWSLADRAPIQEWAVGRVVLLGDAAHPMVHYLAQGACQALEDAIVLGESLDLEPDPAQAFNRYVAMRLGRTTALQRLSRLSISLWHSGDIAARARDRALMAMTPDELMDHLSWIHAERAGADHSGGVPSARQAGAVTLARTAAEG